MSGNKHVFTIEHTINKATELPFGTKYAGDFTVRRPTLSDKREIALRDTARISLGGAVNPAHLAVDVVNINFVFANMDVIGEQKPEWFDIGKLYEGEDEQAVIAVWQEVERWLATFRPQGNSPTSGD